MAEPEAEAEPEHKPEPKPEPHFPQTMAQRVFFGVGPWANGKMDKWANAFKAIVELLRKIELRQRRARARPRGQGVRVGNPSICLMCLAASL